MKGFFQDGVSTAWGAFGELALGVSVAVSVAVSMAVSMAMSMTVI